MRWERERERQRRKRDNWGYREELSILLAVTRFSHTVLILVKIIFVLSHQMKEILVKKAMLWADRDKGL